VCKVSIDLLHIWVSYGKFCFGGHLEYIRHLGFTRCLTGDFPELMYLITQNSLVFEKRWKIDWDGAQSLTHKINNNKTWKKKSCFWYSCRHLKFLRRLGFTWCLTSGSFNTMYLSTQNSLVFENRWRFDWDRVQSVKR
jgi:hypothetical protein